MIRRRPPRPVGAAVLVAIGAAVVAVGCVPLLPHIYYRPEAAGGTTLRNSCWHTDEEVRFTRGAAELGVKILRVDRDRPMLQLTIGLQEGHHARVASSDVDLVDPAGVHHRLSFDGVARDERVDGERMPIASRLDGRTFVATPQPIGRTYWLFAPIDLRDRDTFAVTLPPIEIDDVPFTLPGIRFTRTNEVQPLAPLQC